MFIIWTSEPHKVRHLIMVAFPSTEHFTQIRTKSNSWTYIPLLMSKKQKALLSLSFLMSENLPFFKCHDLSLQEGLLCSYTDPILSFWEVWSSFTHFGAEKLKHFEAFQNPPSLMPGYKVIIVKFPGISLSKIYNCNYKYHSFCQFMTFINYCHQVSKAR